MGPEWREQAGSGAGEIAEIGRALLATVRRLGFILAMESMEVFKEGQ